MASPEERERFAVLTGQSRPPASAISHETGPAADAERRLAADENISGALGRLDRLSGWQPGTARRRVAERLTGLDRRELLDRASFLVVTHVAGDMGRQTPGAVEAARRLSELLPQRVNPRDHAQVTKFFDGLELVEPGVVPVQQWRPPSDEEAAARASLWGGVARKL
jgi:hypothetical protein